MSIDHFAEHRGPIQLYVIVILYTSVSNLNHFCEHMDFCSNLSSPLPFLFE